MFSWSRGRLEPLSSGLTSQEIADGALNVGLLGSIAGGYSPVMSNVAAPCAIGVWQRPKACDGPLSLFEVAIQQVDGQATTGNRAHPAPP